MPTMQLSRRGHIDDGAVREPLEAYCDSLRAELLSDKATKRKVQVFSKLLQTDHGSVEHMDMFQTNGSSRCAGGHQAPQRSAGQRPLLAGP